MGARATGAHRWSRALVTDRGNAVSGWGVRVTGLVMFGDDVIVTGGFTGSVDFGRGSVGRPSNDASLTKSVPLSRLW